MNADRDEVLITACLRERAPFCWRSPGTMLIDGRKVLDVIRRVEAAGYVLIGAEGFEVDPAAIHPRLDLIYDREARIDSIEEVVSEWPPNVWVDLVIS